MFHCYTSLPCLELGNPGKGGGDSGRRGRTVDNLGVEGGVLTILEYGEGVNYMGVGGGGVKNTLG